jgi:hypothetical protein
MNMRQDSVTKVPVEGMCPYTVVEQERGFAVYALGGQPVEVKLEEDYLSVGRPGADALYAQASFVDHIGLEKDLTADYDAYPFEVTEERMGLGHPTMVADLEDPQRTRPCHLLAFDMLLRWICNLLLGGSHALGPSGKSSQVQLLERALHDSIYAQWQRLLQVLQLVRPDVLKVHRLLWPYLPSRRLIDVSCHGDLWLPERWPQLYERHYLVRDISKYVAARIAVARWWDFPALIMHVKTLPPEFMDIVYGMVPDLYYSLHSPQFPGRYVDRAGVLDGLENWWDLYSPTGHAYSSLNKTLDSLNLPVRRAATNVPIRIRAEYLPLLRYIELERPITNRLELALLLATHNRYLAPEPEPGEYVEDYPLIAQAAPPQARMNIPIPGVPMIALPGPGAALPDPTDPPAPEAAEVPEVLAPYDEPMAGTPNLHVFMHARETQIVEAMKRVGAYLHEELNPRQMSSVVTLVQILGDYPEKHHGGLLGLCNKAIRWHRERDAEELEETLARYGGDCKTRVPPLDLSGHPELRFLDCVSAIVEEARHMHHCIDQHVPYAINGDSYLFHVDYGGEEASIELSSYGRVLQAYGPHNTSNVAATYGRKLLNRLWHQQVLRATR